MIKIGNKTFVYKKSDIVIDTPNKMVNKGEGVKYTFSTIINV